MSARPSGKQWTPSEVDTIRKMTAAGLSKREIGKFYGVTRAAIIGVTHRNDLAKNPEPPRDLGPLRHLIEQSLGVRSISDTYALFSSTISPPVSRKQIERIAAEMAPEAKHKPTRNPNPAPSQKGLSDEVRLARQGSNELRDRCIALFAKTARERGKVAEANHWAVLANQYRALA